mmetsp:Transcript_5748/g.22228  ORF Transcript_5748/g.22228 Transcript_5748/m.22228 type:complete len:274 (-) Transcript_5748:858-1679(-)
MASGSAAPGLAAVTAKVIGSTPSRSERDTPSSRSFASAFPCSEAPAIWPASAGSAVVASTSMREGSTISNSTSRGSTTWPTARSVRAMTPATGATSASRAARLPPMLRSRWARLCASLRAASISLRGTVPSRPSSRCTRCSASWRCAFSSANWACCTPSAYGSAWWRTYASTVPRCTDWPATGRPFGPGSMRPPCTACTRPLALGSITIRPGSSTVAAASDSGASRVRMAMRRCAAFGTLTLPSGRRARLEAFTAAPGASRCSPPGPWAPGAA